LKPLLKEYRDAECGVTNGIPMVERKSEALKEHKKDVKRITLGQIAILFLTVIVIKGQATDKVNQYIHDKYDQKNANVTEPLSFSIDMMRTLSNDKYSSDDLMNDMAESDMWNSEWISPEAYNQTRDIWNTAFKQPQEANETSYVPQMPDSMEDAMSSWIPEHIPMPPIKVPKIDHSQDKHHDGHDASVHDGDDKHHHEEDHHDDEKHHDKHHGEDKHHDDDHKKDKHCDKHSESGHSDKHHDKMMGKMRGYMNPSYDFDDMTAEQACAFVGQIIGGVCIFIFVYATICILLS